MPKLLQINVTANWGSHGRIAELIGRRAIANGWDSYIAYGRYMNPSESKLIKIGNKIDFYIHVLGTRLFDGHGLCSSYPTKKLLKKIGEIQPDIVHIHNIHGYYLNYKVLLKYLSENNIPVVLTMHDCWTITGHCAHFFWAGCYKWKTGCQSCPMRKSYPSSWFYDNSNKSFELKKKLFTSLSSLTMVPVCQWLADFLPDSFLKNVKFEIIHNGIDTKIFQPYTNCDIIKKKYEIPLEKQMILGVASVWDKHRGLSDILKVQSVLGDNFVSVLVGLKDEQIRRLPQNCIGITRTDNLYELAKLYSAADVYLNPSYCDSFSTTNVEAISCGTPVVSYMTAGNAESLTSQTGIVVECGDVDGLIQSVKTICENGKALYLKECRQRAVNLFNMELQYEKYINLYMKILNE